jgi:type IV secretory pathway VirB4 component
MDENQLTSLKGEVSWFYSLSSPDIDQMNNLNFDSFIQNLRQALCKLKADEFYKIYHISDNFFLNSTSEIPDLTGLELKKEITPMECFFEGDVNSSIDFFEDYLLVNNTFKRIISFKELPLELGVSDLQGFGDMALTFKRVDNVRAKSKLNFKRKMHFSHLFQDIKNVDSTNAYSEAEKLLEDISNHDDSMSDCSCYLTISADSKTGLDNKTSETLKHLKGIDSIPRVESRALQSIFLEIIPGCSPIFVRSHLMPTSYLVNLLPLKRDFIHDTGLALKSRRDKEILCDIFDPCSHNFNCLISGESGQGKSVLANELLHHYVGDGSSAVVLDLGNSFLKTTKSLNGNIFSKSFNPLSFDDPEYLREFILSFIDISWGQIEQGRLLKVIREQIGDVSSFRELIIKLEYHFDGLSLYFEDLWQFFDETKYCNSKLIYCDLGLYPERIKRPLIIYLIECFKNQSGRRLFIFDECWDLLEHNADYLAKCFRTFRKYNASAIAISQNVDDFSGSRLGKVILQNTFYKFLFKQTLLGKTFLNSFETELVYDLRSQKKKFSECLIVSEQICKIARLFISPLKYELYTSDAGDNLMLEGYMKEKGHFLEFNTAMQNYTYLKYEKELYE